MPAVVHNTYRDPLITPNGHSQAMEPATGTFRLFLRLPIPGQANKPRRARRRPLALRLDACRMKSWCGCQNIVTEHCLSDRLITSPPKFTLARVRESQSDHGVS